jgi:hypothetical protein
MTDEENMRIYEEYRKNWEISYNAQKEQDDNFDKTLMALSSGSFGISFAFIDHIVSLQCASKLPLLVVSWACFAFCLVILLIGFRISSTIHSNICKEIYEEMNIKFEGKEADIVKDRSIMFNWSNVLNHIALISFIGGIVCLLLFILMNV